MKSVLKAASTAIMRGLAYYRMRSIEITLQGVVVVFIRQPRQQETARSSRAF